MAKASKVAARPKKLSTKSLARVPVALARRAEALSAQKRKRLIDEARGLLALVARRRTEVAEAFYDIGEALTRLKDREMLLALGMKSFAELCEKKLSLSPAMGQQLVAVVASMTREQALAMGQTKAIAMVALAAATPEDDTPAGLFEAGHVRVPGGGAIDTRTASARKIERVAKRIRDAHDAGKPRRGRTTTAEERLYASKLEAALRKAGLDHATAEVVATRPGQPSELRLAHVPLDAVATLARVLARSRRS